jgi:hypothetical protein
LCLFCLLQYDAQKDVTATATDLPRIMTIVSEKYQLLLNCANRLVSSAGYDLKWCAVTELVTRMRTIFFINHVERHAT